MAAEFRELGFEPALHLLGRADRRGGFQDDQVAGSDEWGNRTRGGFDERKIWHAGAIHRGDEWRRHREDEDVSRRGLRRGLEVTGLHRGAYEDVEVRFLDMNAAAIDRLDD